MQDAWRLRYLGLSPPAWLTRTSTVTSTTTTTSTPSTLTPPTPPTSSPPAMTPGEISVGASSPPGGRISPSSNTSPIPSDLSAADRLAMATRLVIINLNLNFF